MSLRPFSFGFTFLREREGLPERLGFGGLVGAGGAAGGGASIAGGGAGGAGGISSDTGAGAGGVGSSSSAEGSGTGEEVLLPECSELRLAVAEQEGRLMRHLNHQKMVVEVNRPE